MCDESHSYINVWYFWILSIYFLSIICEVFGVFFALFLGVYVIRDDDFSHGDEKFVL